MALITWRGRQLLFMRLVKLRVLGSSLLYVG